MKRRLKIPGIIAGLIITAGLLALTVAMWRPVVMEITNVEPGPARPAPGDTLDFVCLSDGCVWAGKVASIDGTDLILRDARHASMLFPGAGTGEPRGVMTFRISLVAEIALDGRYSAGMPSVPRVYLADGSVLAAMPENLSEDVLTVALHGPVMPVTGGTLKVNAGNLAGISFAAWRNPCRDDSEKDILILHGGGTVTGEVCGISKTRIAVLNPDREKPEYVDCGNVLTLTFHMRNEGEQNEEDIPTCVVYLADGSRIKGVLISLDEEALSLRSPALGDLSIARNAIKKISFSEWNLLDEFPVVLNEPGIKASYTPSGTILAADENGRSVYEIDRTGRVVWEYPKKPLGGSESEYRQTVITIVSYAGIRRLEYRRRLLPSGGDLEKPTGAVRLRNGNTLICDYGNNSVIEVSREGKVVWRAPALGVMSCSRLKCGRTLIAENHSGRVVEVCAGGDVIWEVGGLENIVDAHRQPDGNTLALYGSDSLKLRKMNAKGKTLWEVGDFAYPAYILACGGDRILICETRKCRLTILDNMGGEKRMVNLRPPPESRTN